MDKQKRLEAAGWTVGGAAEFVGLSADEALDMAGKARRWARAWKGVAIRTSAALRFQCRITDKQGADILALEEALQKTRPLLQETVNEHRDPLYEVYNGCDLAPCQWCVEARELLGETQ